ncbi:MAG: tRNA-guanine transglycosylase, partial [Cyanobacteria bacterium]|nr:tRNA-guanine transglycosylase [Cyanobacteriota bacterium]
FATQMDAKGFAIGGVSVGESKEWVQKVVEFTAPLLPSNKPRYLMGVGTPEDLLDSIKSGVDMFDCVMPTRIARHGSFFTPMGRRIIKNAEFLEDFTPLVEGCGCYSCQHHTKAYIKHLYRQKESTASTLISIHNIYSLVSLAQNARKAILAGTFQQFYDEQYSQLFSRGDHRPSLSK